MSQPLTWFFRATELLTGDLGRGTVGIYRTASGKWGAIFHGDGKNDRLALAKDEVGFRNRDGDETALPHADDRESRDLGDAVVLVMGERGTLLPMFELRSRLPATGTTQVVAFASVPVIPRARGSA